MSNPIKSKKNNPHIQILWCLVIYFPAPQVIEFTQQRMKWTSFADVTYCYSATVDGLLRFQNTTIDLHKMMEGLSL